MSHSGYRKGIILPAIALIFTIMTASCNEQTPNLDDGLYARFATTKGNIFVELLPEQAPLTVTNFVGLAEGKLDFANKKGHFYDGLTFHRVIADFMIQGGDPDGTGSGGPGYRFADETDGPLKFDGPGVLAMANAGPNTNGSQFFITHVPTPWLDGKHTIFGRVVQGQDVVDAMEQGDAIEEVRILRIGADAEAFVADTNRFNELSDSIEERQRVAKEAAEKAILDDIAARWPDAVQDEETGVFSIVRTEGSGTTPAPGTQITVHYTGTLMDGTEFDSSRRRNEPFKFNVASNQVIPGWDFALSQMKKGERRVIILPPSMAYGERGIGPIPPNAWLVFDVELIDF